MKIVYQQRNKLKNTCVLFPMISSNVSNMLYYYYLINKRYKNVDYTCVNTTNIELENIFNLVIKMPSNFTIIEIIKSFVKSTTHRKILIILDNLVFESNNKLLMRLPEELPKKGMYFDFFNKDICKLKISKRNSILKYYQVCRQTTMFLDIGKKESKSRQKLIDKMESFTKEDNLILLKRNIESFKCSEEKVENLDVIYKTIRRKKIEITNKEIMNLINIQSLPINKYGIQLHIKRSYEMINERFTKIIKSSLNDVNDKSDDE